jgi:hypothetical protein
VKPLEGYRSPIPKDQSQERKRELINQITDLRDYELKEEIEREKELRETIFEIEADLENLENLGSRPDLKNPASIYNNLKGLKRKDESFLFRNTLGRGLPDSVGKVSQHTKISKRNMEGVYEKVRTDEVSEEEALKCIELMQYEGNSDLIELRTDPTEDLNAATEELGRVRYHLGGVADRSRERYEELTDEIEESFQCLVQNQEDMTEEDFSWTFTTYIRY